MSGAETARLEARARQVLPGVSQLLSKRPESFLPDGWPAYFRSARGCEVVDLDGRRFVDVSHMSVGTCLLGYADPDVEEAVIAAVRAGNMATLNAPEEVALAERLCGLHPWAGGVRYARTGGEAMAMAVRIARAATGRDRVVFSGYHGWHDWYLAANLADVRNLDVHLLPGLEPRGVPRALEGTAVPFSPGDVASFDAAVATCGDDLAAIVMEPMRYERPSDAYLEHVRATADRLGAVLVFDEITTGFRLALGGIHTTYGVKPDVAVFAKAMSNGHPMAALIGRQGVMEASTESFISSTYWTDRVGPAAALATIDALESRGVADHLRVVGQRMQDGWRAAGERHGVPVNVKGPPALSSLVFDSAELRHAFTRGMLERGFLAGGAFYPTWAHRSEHVEAALAAVNEVFATL